MYFDALTISAVADELMDRLVGGRIQDSVDVDGDVIGLEVYAGHQRHYLLLSAEQHAPRVQIVPEKLRRGLPRPSQLVLLFRRLVEGGVLEHVSQPAWERVLVLDVSGPEGVVQIIAEPMERRANLVLVKEGTVLDCMRRVSPQVNRVRVVQPGQPYQPPPEQVGKLDPFLLTREQLMLVLAEAGAKDKTAGLLTARLLGFSPLLAREAAFRAGAQPDARALDVDADRLFDAIQTLAQPLMQRKWQPGIAEGERGARAFSVYPLRSVPGWQPVASVSEALTWFYHAPVGHEAYEAARQPLREAIAEAQGRLAGKIASLESGLKDERERERLRQSGELILAYQYTFTQGQTELVAEYDVEAPPLRIALDPAISPLENAQRYFERYAKAKRALEDVPRLLAEARAEHATLAQLETDLSLAANWPEIDEVQQALQAMGHWRGRQAPKMGGGRSGPLRVLTDDQFVLWVGRNSRQNEQVTFEKGSPADLWLHARGVPGAHVIVRYDGRPFPEAVIERAAALAAYYSAHQAEARVDVDVTERRFVRRMRGAGPGMVTYRGERTVAVRPQGA